MTFLETYLAQITGTGSRNHDLFAATLCAREEGWDENRIRAELGSKAQRDGLKPPEINVTIKSALRRNITLKERREYKRTRWSAVTWTPDVRESRLPESVPPKRNATVAADFSAYIQAVFKPGEHINIMNTSKLDEDEGKWKPHGYGITRTREQWLQNGPPPHEKAAGLWVRLNPTDGKGVSDSNTTDYRHCLVESDEMTLPQQWAAIRRLQLPCAAIVHSGAKSLHVVVTVDAGHDRELYDNRVSQVFEACKDAGMVVDTANKNPSRLSRMPGVQRGTVWQYLLPSDFAPRNWEAYTAQLADGSIGPVSASQSVLDDINAAIAGQLVAVPLPWRGVHVGTQALLPGAIVVVCGAVGSAKSFWSMHAAMSAFNEGYKVAILEVEEPPQFHQHRILAILVRDSQYLNIEWRRYNPERAIGYYHQTKDKLDEYSDVLHDGTKIKNLPNAAKWVEHVASKGARIIIIDPISLLESGSNHWDGASEFMNSIKTTCEQSGASIILVTHPKKGAQSFGTDDLCSGAAFSRNASVILWLERHPDMKGMVHGPQGFGFLETVHNRTVHVLKARNSNGAGRRYAFQWDDSHLEMTELGLLKNEEPKARRGPKQSQQPADNTAYYNTKDFNDADDGDVPF